MLKDLSAGRDRSHVVMRDGRLLTWGNIRRERKLPDGPPGAMICTSSTFQVGHNRFADPRPGCLNPGSVVSSVADGFSSSLATTSDGRVVSFRPVLNEDGPEPHSAGFFPSVPEDVLRVGATENTHFALRSNGELWSWGAGESGVLGRPSYGFVASPYRIPLSTRIQSIAFGYSHILALDSLGSVWSWGANGAGQLGVGDLKDRAKPVRLMLPARIVQVAAGHTHSFAVDDVGMLWAWGSNNFGQLGSKTISFSSKPIVIRLPFDIHRLDAGMHYSLAGSTDGDVFAWGWNGTGQLARNDLAASPTPSQVRGLRHVSRLSAGVTHALGANDHQLFAWGDNRSAACGVSSSQKVQFEPYSVALS